MLITASTTWTMRPSKFSNLGRRRDLAPWLITTFSNSQDCKTNSSIWNPTPWTLQTEVIQIIISMSHFRMKIWQHKRIMRCILPVKVDRPWVIKALFWLVTTNNFNKRPSFAMRPFIAQCNIADSVVVKGIQEPLSVIHWPWARIRISRRATWTSQLDVHIRTINPYLSKI